MTVASQRQKQKVFGEITMDGFAPTSDCTDFLSPAGETISSTDLLDTSIYASSPNSLYMYDQEKGDMQSSFGIPPTTGSFSYSDDFDLSSQYEVSHDISASLLPSVQKNSAAKSPLKDSTHMWGEIGKVSKMEEVLQFNLNPATVEPTLAELNETDSYLDGLLVENFLAIDPVDSDVKGKNKDNTCSTSASFLCDTHKLVKEESPLDSISDSNFYTGISLQHWQNDLASMSSASSLYLVKKETNERGSSLHGQKSCTVLLPDSLLGGPLSNVSFPVKLENEALNNLSKTKGDNQSQLLKLLQKNSVSLPKEESFSLKIPTSVSALSATQGVGTNLMRKRTSSTAGLESMDEKWEELKEIIFTEGDLDKERQVDKPEYVRVKRERYDSGSSIVSYEELDSEHGEVDDDWHSDSDDDGYHDDELPLEPGESLLGHDEKQYFWQYNLQSKGPKGQRVQFSISSDPHILHDFEDPVFDSSINNVSGIGVSIKHGGKARKGDGNDIIPNPKKLFQIGLQLRKISRQINEFAPVSELPSSARSLTRKEKNKLASRACRMKKKAQHEANKVKLYGLEQEQRQLLDVLRKIRLLLIRKLEARQEEGEVSEKLTENLENLIKEHLDIQIAGNTTEYVNNVIRCIEQGDITGGIHHMPG